MPYPVGEVPSPAGCHSSGSGQDVGGVGFGIPPLRSSYHLLGADGRRKHRSRGRMFRRVLLHLVLPALRVYLRVLLTFHLRGLLQLQHLSQHPAAEPESHGARGGREGGRLEGHRRTGLVRLLRQNAQGVLQRAGGCFGRDRRRRGGFAVIQRRSQQHTLRVFDNEDDH